MDTLEIQEPLCLRPLCCTIPVRSDRNEFNCRLSDGQNSWRDVSSAATSIDSKVLFWPTTGGEPSKLFILAYFRSIDSFGQFAPLRRREQGDREQSKWGYISPWRLIAEWHEVLGRYASRRTAHKTEDHHCAKDDRYPHFQDYKCSTYIRSTCPIARKPIDGLRLLDMVGG
ncbi:uncharacterized protein BDV17DRAFT_237527 [Aspergillus undulatus]|uniref:uncharacterized protein n=1 Tax=Aspergillus undulatus TaxID=1810928 RepID=UPI003CCCD629